MRQDRGTSDEKALSFGDLKVEYRLDLIFLDRFHQGKTSHGSQGITRIQLAMTQPRPAFQKR